MSSALWELVQSGLTDRQIGEQLGLTKDQVRHKRVALGRTMVSPESSIAPAILEAPQPFAVPIPSPAKPVSVRGAKRGFIIPDVHVPYHDEAAVSVMESLLRAFDPHYLVCIGDLMDAGRLSSKFPTDPARIDTLQGDIVTARTKLHQWAQLAPNARRWLLEGNHEQRLTRLIWGLQGADRELARLEDVRAAATWPHLLRLDQCGWEWVGYDDQPRDDILPHLLVKHGNFVAAEAGMTARREWQKAGRSGVSGHTHRAAVWRHRDWNGQATWIEAGCLCDLGRTPGANNPNWQQAVTMIEWNEDESLMHVEQVLIRDGKALWRGEEVAA